MKFSQSYAGLALMTIYLAFAVPTFNYSMDCESMFCDFAAIPVIYPIGIWITQLLSFLSLTFRGPDYLAIPTKSLIFIIPTMLGNALCYYWVGAGMGWFVKTIRSKIKRKRK